MERVREVVEQVLTAVRDSNGITNSSDLEELDRVLLSLSRSSVALGELLNLIIIGQEISAQSEAIVELQELLSCVDMILLDKEHIFHLPGHGKKPINIGMVSIVY